MISKNMRSYIQSSRALAHKRHMQTVKGNIAADNAYLRGVDIKSADEPSAASARAVDKVLRLPNRDAST